MATTATPTLTAGPAVGPLGQECEFTLLLDTTDGSGLMTVDLTDYFSYVTNVEICGSLASTGYVVNIQKPAVTLSATNVVLGFYEAGADGAELDLVAATDFSAVITGLTIKVTGKTVLDTTWA